MRQYDSKYGYDGTGAKEKMIARVEETKRSSEAGKTRLVVREKGKTRSHAIIDIDMKVAKDLKEKETYVFAVNEKDNSRVPGFQRKKSAEFKAFQCSDTPEIYVPGSEIREKMSRFGSASTAGQSSRIKF
jgi:hypothetical protein